MLELRLLSAEIKRREFLGSYIHTLVFSGAMDSEMDGPQTALAIHDTQAILDLAPNLTKLKIAEFLVFVSMPVLVRTCVASLRKLHLVFSDVEQHGLGALAYVGRFHALESLTLDVTPRNSQVDIPAVSDITPWILPRLRVLKISAGRYWPISGFLSLCHFSSLQDLSFLTSTHNADEVQSIGNFFASILAQRITLLAFSLYGQIAVARLRTVSSLHLLQYSCLSVIEHIPTSVRTLSFSLPREDRDTEWTELYRVLDSLSVREVSIPDIHLRDDFHLDAFVWITESVIDINTTPTTVTGEQKTALLSYSNKLAKKGTNLRDTAGKTVMDYYT
jgi:hypothetical protein